MRRLSLDFLHPVRERRSVGTLVLIAALAAVVGSLGRQHSLMLERDSLVAQSAEAKRAARRQWSSIQPIADAKSAAQEVIRANAVLANLALPWDELFGELEAASHPNVALLSILPESSGRRVRLVGEARRFEELLVYISQVEATAGFANAMLAKHELRPSGGETVVSFTLTADWAGQP